MLLIEDLRNPFDLHLSRQACKFLFTIFEQISFSVKNLLYLIALDPPHGTANRLLAKLAVSSLLRTWFTGDIVLLRNTPEPVFPVERKGLREIEITDPDYDAAAPGERGDIAMRWKWRARHLLKVKGYDKVVMLDADWLALRNIDHLLDGDWEVAWCPERGGRSVTDHWFHCFLTDEEMVSLARHPGANGGILAVVADRYHALMEEWERIDSGPVTRRRICSDQASLNRLLLDTKLKKHRFEGGELSFPLLWDNAYRDYTESALVHGAGGNSREKHRFLFGLYMQSFYHDEHGTFLQMLEM
jgi:hypothetical protein